MKTSVRWSIGLLNCWTRKFSELADKLLLVEFRQQVASWKITRGRITNSLTFSPSQYAKKKERWKRPEISFVKVFHFRNFCLTVGRRVQNWWTILVRFSIVQKMFFYWVTNIFDNRALSLNRPSTVSVEITTIFCRLYYFLVPLTFF